MNRTSTILIVDDEEIIRNILAKLIHALGYSVLQASNSTQAVSMMRQHKPEVVLLDIVMPGVDSMEVLHTARDDNSLKSTAIILISGIDSLDTISTYIEAGADDFLPKPFNSALLNMKIRNALERMCSQQYAQTAAESNEAFCSQLAHDLNNALTGIMMTTELLLMEQPSASSKQHLEGIIESTEQISAIIKQRRKSMRDNDKTS
jgi:DNA-binding response OmpR family regulator